jgi:hypothetical protein
MDFLDPKKRRGYNIRLFVGFILIGVAIVLATTILALITAGYSINSKTGQVIQNSLVFVNSQPVSANLYVNGAANGRTNAKLELSSGSYTFLLKQSGYHSWTNTLSILGGQVEQLIYPFLFPTSPVKTTATTLSAEPTVASSSPDRHWLLVSIPDQFGSFYVVDLTNPKAAITTVTIPTAVLANGPGTNTITAVEWSTDNTHLLLKDSYQGGAQYIILDRTTPADSLNISQSFPSTPFTTIRFDNGLYDHLYLYNQSTQTLVLADTTTKTIAGILSNVIAYWPYSTNQILYTTPDATNPNEVDADLWYSGGTNYTLRELPVGTGYELNMASYNGNLYVVIGSNASSYAYIYMNPLTELAAAPNQLPLPSTLLIVTGTPGAVSFSDSARYIALQSGSQFAVYDIETDTHYRYDTGLQFQPGQLATWMDGDRLDAVINGELTIWDFDGTNMIPFIPATSAFLPAFTQGYDAIYTLIPQPTSTTGQWQIVRNSLIADHS